MTKWRVGLLAATVSVAAISAATSAHAGAFALKERSTKGQGLSFAGVTAGSGGLSSMGFNPAAIGLVADGADNGEMSGGISLILPITEGQPNVGGVPVGASVDAGRFAGLGNGYIGYRLEDDILIGASMYTPFGLTTQYEAGWLGQFDALTSKLTTLVIAPTVGWEPIPELTLAASLNILYADIRLTSAAGQLDGKRTDVGFSVGALWEPTPTTKVGIAWQHGYDLKVGGDFVPTGSPVAFGIQANAELPGVASIGLVQELTDDIRIMGEAQWQNWSVFDRIDVVSQTLGLVQSDVQNYDDAFFFALGGEYDVTNDFTLRLGSAWDQTPTNSGTPAGLFPAAVNPLATNRTARVPDEDRIWLSIGASYNVNDHMSLDIGYSYLFALEDSVVQLRNAPAGANVSYEGQAHILSIGGSLKF